MDELWLVILGALIGCLIAIFAICIFLGNMFIKNKHELELNNE